MIAIICIQIICSMFVCIYWLQIDHNTVPPKNEQGILPPVTRDISLPVIPGTFPTYKPGPSALTGWEAKPPSAMQGTALQAKTSAPEALDAEIIPKLAQDYLDAEKKLIKRAQKEDMQGMSMIGDITRKEAAGCRSKAEKLIKEAN